MQNYKKNAELSAKIRNFSKDGKSFDFIKFLDETSYIEAQTGLRQFMSIFSFLSIEAAKEDKAHEYFGYTDDIGDGFYFLYHLQEFLEVCLSEDKEFKDFYYNIDTGIDFIFDMLDDSCGKTIDSYLTIIINECNSCISWLIRQNIDGLNSIIRKNWENALYTAVSIIEIVSKIKKSAKKSVSNSAKKRTLTA